MFCIDALIRGLSEMKKLIAGLCGAALMASAAVHAEGPTELRPYLGLGYQHIPEDEDRNSSFGNGLYAGGGVPLNQHFVIEGDMYYDRWSRDGAGDPNKWRDYGAEAAGLLTFPVGNGWVPFFMASAGVGKTKLYGVGESTDFVYGFGGGTFYLFEGFGRDWGLRFDARYRAFEIGDGVFGDGSIPTGNDDKIGEAVVRFGMLTLLGSRPEAAAPVEQAKPEGDADGDGVVDSKDQCPDTPKGVKVDEKGCPLPTNVGSEADALKRYGPIYFDYNKADIKLSERAKLDTAVKEVNAMKNGKIVLRLYGHTDSVGTPEYNQSLGERRATAVKKYLTAKGIKAEQIEITSYGESKPAADNDTDKGRALNRRVEVLVVEE